VIRGPDADIAIRAASIFFGGPALGSLGPIADAAFSRGALV